MSEYKVCPRQRVFYSIGIANHRLIFQAAPDAAGALALSVERTKETGEREAIFVYLGPLQALELAQELVAWAKGRLPS